MNLILLFDSDFIGGMATNLNGAISGHVRISDRRYEHIREILKSIVGDELCVGLLNSRIGTGRVTVVDNNAAEMDVVLDRDPPQPMPITLVLALPRPIVLRRLLHQIAALGLKSIVLVHTERVEKSYWKSPILKEENMRQRLIAGLEQAKDTVMPEVLIRRSFKQFVEGELPDIIKGKTAYVADPDGSAFGRLAASDPIVLAIGPEGGFIPEEVERFKALGFASISFGKRILRVETAAIVAIAKLSM